MSDDRALALVRTPDSELYANAPPGTLPPHDLDAEAAVLSALLLNASAQLPRVRDFLRPEMFYSEAHRRVYEAMVEIALADSTAPIDVVIVGEWLKKHDRIAQVGGMGFLTDLLGAAPAVANVVAYARIVHDRYRERRAIWTCQKIAARGYLGVPDTQAFLDRASRAIAEIAQSSIDAEMESNATILSSILTSASERAAAERDGTAIQLDYPTGIPCVDAEWGGLHDTDLSTVIARPGAGKTTLGLQIAIRTARTGIAVHMFCQDMDARDLLTRALGHIAVIDWQRIKHGKLRPEEWPRVAEASDELARLPIRIERMRGMHVEAIRARVVAHGEKLARRKVSLKVVIVDYLQQLKPAPHLAHATKAQYLEHALVELKALADGTRISVLGLAQQKRPDRGKEVLLASDCSQIEKEPDNVWFLLKKGERGRRLHTEKARRGREKHLDLSFDPAAGIFGDARLEAASRAHVDQTPPPGFFAGHDSTGDTE